MCATVIDLECHKCIKLNGHMHLNNGRPPYQVLLLSWIAAFSAL